MVVRVVKFEETPANSQQVASSTTTSVELSRRLTTSTIVDRSTGGTTIGEIGRTVIANAVAGPVAPPNPYEGQVWIEVDLT